MRLTHRGSTFNNGPLTTWSEEGLMLLETYREPLDAGVVKIIDAFELREPIKVEVNDIVDRPLLNGFVCVHHLLNSFCCCVGQRVFQPHSKTKKQEADKGPNLIDLYSG